jgi:hypothetical protein
MPNELVKASAVIVPAPGASPELPVMVERAGEAARFGWDEFFYAEHHNPHTQKAYMRAVRRGERQCSRLMTQNSCLPTSSPFGLQGRTSQPNSGIALKLNLLCLKQVTIDCVRGRPSNDWRCDALFPSKPATGKTV